jgi:hypothetical protein
MKEWEYKLFEEKNRYNLFNMSFGCEACTGILPVSKTLQVSPCLSQQQASPPTPPPPALQAFMSEAQIQEEWLVLRKELRPDWVGCHRRRGTICRLLVNDLKMQEDNG